MLPKHLTSMNIGRFDQCPISPLSLKAIKDAGYEKMTVVQEATLPVILKGLFVYDLRRRVSELKLYLVCIHRFFSD